MILRGGLRIGIAPLARVRAALPVSAWLIAASLAALVVEVPPHARSRGGREAGEATPRAPRAPEIEEKVIEVEPWEEVPT
jgi:hypothetical protein